MVKQIEKSFRIMKERNWDRVYFLFDIHETIVYPSYDENKESFKFYPFAKEALQLITRNPNIINILWSCSSKEKLEAYNQFFKECGIKFDYINENPEVESNDLSNFDQKLYCNVGFDDKFGFNPETDWEEIYKYFISIN